MSTSLGRCIRWRRSATWLRRLAGRAVEGLLTRATGSTRPEGGSAMTASGAFEVSVEAVRRRFHSWEIGVDGAIHACAIVAAIVGAAILIVFAASRGGAKDILAVAIYSTGMLAMFAFS